MALRAVAWTVILAGVVALGTLKKQWEVDSAILLGLYAPLPLDCLSLTAATLDLRQRRYNSPGRLFAWPALWVSVLFGVLLLCFAIGI